GAVGRTVGPEDTGLQMDPSLEVVNGSPNRLSILVQAAAGAAGNRQFGDDHRLISGRPNVKHTAGIVAVDDKSVNPRSHNLQAFDDGQIALGQSDRPGQAALKNDAVAELRIGVGGVDAVTQVALQTGAGARISEVGHGEARRHGSIFAYFQSRLE